MKVIDLLNKIANGEGVPETIEYQEEVYGFSHISRGYYRIIDGVIDTHAKNRLYNAIYNGDLLNDEVEIIEEDKKIEKLETYKEIDDEEHYANILKVSKNGEYEINEDLSFVVDKINEIIDKLNETSDKE